MIFFMNFSLLNDHDLLLTCWKVVFGLVYRKEKMVTRQKTSCVSGRDGDKILRQN
jgi:hypothetical protein